MRMNQFILIVTFIAFCWLAFMAVHETGHVVAAVLGGGTVQKVVIHPASISRTDVFSDPNPLVTVWAGPVLGTVLPLLIWLVMWTIGSRRSYLARFFAGFCLIANGAYIGVGSFDRIGDAGKMLQHGSPVWTLWLFGLAAAAIGFWLWHGLGPKFGLGKSAGDVDESDAYISLGLFTVTYLLATLLSPRF